MPKVVNSQVWARTQDSSVVAKYFDLSTYIKTYSYCTSIAKTEWPISKEVQTVFNALRNKTWGIECLGFPYTAF